MSDTRLLPTGASPLEVAVMQAVAEGARVPAPLHLLWNPHTCPVELLPWLAWARAVDRWDANWTETTKRQVIAASFAVHKHKGTLSALRQAVEPLGFTLDMQEWWQYNGSPGTFSLTVSVLDKGITQAMYAELERLIDCTRPVSRHLSDLTISLSTRGNLYVAATQYDGEILTIYPYTADVIVIEGGCFSALSLHLIDSLGVAP